MDFWELTKLIFRRWYVAVPLLVLTGLGAAYTANTVEPDYKATAYVQLIPPPEASIAKNIKDLRNPWLDLGLGALNTAATYATVDRKFLDQLKTTGLSDNVVITNGYPAPIATIEAIGPDQQTAMRTADEVVQRFNEVVKSLQDDYAVQSPGRILTRRLDTGNNLEETGGKVKRALVAVVGAGALVTAGLTIAFDALMRRRRRRDPDEPVEQKPATASGTVVASARPPSAPARSAPIGPVASAPVSPVGTVHGSSASVGDRTVKIQPTPPKETGRRGAVPVVSGVARVNGGGRKAEEPEPPVDGTIIIPTSGRDKAGEGRGSQH